MQTRQPRLRERYKTIDSPIVGILASGALLARKLRTSISVTEIHVRILAEGERERGRELQHWHRSMIKYVYERRLIIIQ